MIESLRLTNFKCHADTSLRLKPFTVLVGPNGSGKTSVLQALQLLSDVRLQSRNPHSPHQSATARRVASSTGLTRRATHSESFAIAARGRTAGTEWSFDLGGANGTRVIFGASATEEADPYSEPEEMPAGPRGDWLDFDRLVFLRPDPPAVAAPTLVRASLELRADATSLASVLANLKLANSPRFGDVLERFRALVPEFRDVSFHPVEMGTKDQSKPGIRMSFDMASGTGVEPSELGDGALALLHIVTFLCTNDAATVLIDGLDRFLHPISQMALAKLLHELTAEQTTRQIVVTTHSPYVLDVIDAAAVMVCASDGHGKVSARSLAEHPDHERMRGGLSTGQLWTLEDEARWVFERRE